MMTTSFCKNILVCFLLVSSTLLFADNHTDKFGEYFLNTPYKANTLIGSIDTKEQLVVRTDYFDCFTFIDYIEASKSDKSIEKAIVDIRYKNGIVEYTKRNHFFSDWVVFNKNIKDITCKVGICKKTLKKLNQKSKNKVYLQGIEIIQREIYYTKPQELRYDKLKNGDYIGIYTTKEGLDVTHVGIAIEKNNSWVFRHASSKAKKVIESNLQEYIKNKDGILIYRSDLQ